MSEDPYLALSPCTATPTGMQWALMDVPTKADTYYIEIMGKQLCYNAEYTGFVIS